MSHIAFLSTIRRIKYTGNSWYYSGADNNLSFLPTGLYGLYGPNALYSAGRTYLCTNTNPYTSNQRPAIIEYYNGNSSLQFMDRDSASEDRHDFPSLINDGTGRISLIMRQHNPSVSKGRVEVWRMATAYDISSFEYKGLSSEFGDYCKPYVNSASEIVFIGRQDPLATGGDGNLYTSTYDNNTTWTTPVQITEHDPSPPAEWTGDARYYPSAFQGHDKDPVWCHLFFSRRLNNAANTAVIYYNQLALKFKRTEPYVIYNLSESFNKNVNTSGALTWAELEANFVFATNTTAPGSGQWTGYIDQNQIYSTFVIDGNLHQYKFLNNQWTDQGVISSEFVEQMFLDGNSGLKSDDVNLQKRITRFFLEQKTENIFTVDDGIWRMNAPMNFSDIPVGQKFAVTVGTLKNGDKTTENNTNENDIYVLEFKK